jgi:hypothetical protein
MNMGVMRRLPRHEVECYLDSFIYSVLLVTAATVYTRDHAGGEDILWLSVSGVAPLLGIRYPLTLAGQDGHIPKHPSPSPPSPASFILSLPL